MPSLALSFLAGIVLVQQLPVLPNTAWLMAGLACIGLFALLHWWRVLFFIIGMLLAILFASFRLNDQLSPHLEGQDIQLQGTVVGLPEREPNYVRFNFKTEGFNQGIPSQLRLTWYYPDQAIKAGQDWLVTVRLKRPHGNFNPGGFDYERWLFLEGIGATGYVRPQPQPALLESASQFNLSAWRQNLADRMDNLLGGNPSLPMIKALTIGEGESLSPHEWEVFRLTGTTHLMVISGSHIGLIAGLAYLLTVRLWAWNGVLAWSPQKVAAIAALLVALFYAGLTGFSVPSQRAAVMVAIAMIAIVGQRNTQSYHILAVALFAVLIIDPLAVLSAGFWLSFVAVGLIIYTMAGRLAKPSLWLGGFKINWVTSIGLAPLLLFFFQQVSLVAPLANLIAVPIISILVVPLALSAMLVMLISPLMAAKLFLLVTFLLQGLWWVLVKLAELPLSTINHTQPSWWALGFAIPGLALLFAPKGFPSRWLGLAMLSPLLFTSSEKIADGHFKLSLLDVGQGLSAVVQTSGHTLVYDTGAKFSSTSDAGQSVLIPFLRSQGIDKIDALLVSHGDNDHIGGVESLLASYPVEKLLTSVPQLLGKHQPERCKAGQSWIWDNIKFSILSPQPGLFASDNDNSCVLLVQAQTGIALLPGDIEAEAESWLVKTYGSQLKAEVLVAPHHGSQTSSTSRFLETVQPKAVLIPAGYRNQFGHPHEEIVARYRTLGFTPYNNTFDGALLVTLPELKVDSWRAMENRYWNYRN